MSEIPAILFVTQTLGHKKACGIGIMGDMVGNVLTQSTEYAFHVVYADNHDPIEAAIAQHNPVAIFYNYAFGSTPWMDDQVMRNKYSHIPHLKINHDMVQAAIDSFVPGGQLVPGVYSHGGAGWQYIVSDDPTLVGTNNVFITQRLMPPYAGPFYPDPEIPTIGFQGFGPWHKGIGRLAALVNNEFDRAIIRLHIPAGFYGDPSGQEGLKRVQECRQALTKPGIEVHASHDFKTREEVIDMLARNTINCYLYDFNAGGGLASSPDFALAARKPIAVSKSHQLRNYWNLTPSVCIEDRPLRDIIASGLEPLRPLHEMYTAGQVIKDYNRILNTVLGK